MPSHSEMITVEGSDLELYFSLPGGPRPLPTILVIHHGAGLDRFTRDMADRLAQEGYAAVAPDLFHRLSPEMLADPSTRWQHWSDPEFVTDLAATLDHLQGHPASNTKRMGITGFCVGGRIVWLAVATFPHFKAAVPYYGAPIMVPWGKATKSPFDLTSQISCPIMFHFGELDTNPSPADMSRLDAELTRWGKPHRFYTYPGADHAFMDHTGPRYTKAAAEASWPRTLEFFATHLKGERKD